MLMYHTGDVTKILAENIAKINHRFGTLVRTITKRMTRRDVDVSSFRLHIFTVFGNVSICRDNVASIMEDLTRYRILKYDCCVHIEQIAKEFVDNDADLKRQIHKYKAELAGFKATTKIVEYIKVCKKEEELTDSDQSLEKNSNHYTEKYCRKLSVKLNSRVNKMSLDYIDELWKSIADACMIPHLPVLLESIKAGCVKVTWFVPTESALQIEEIITSTKIVKMFDVIRLIMNDKILYDKVRSIIRECVGRPID